MHTAPYPIPKATKYLEKQSVSFTFCKIKLASLMVVVVVLVVMISGMVIKEKKSSYK